MKYVSGAKSVKQYRGDENLPEAKNGMKNCGCKHPKSKYRYGTNALAIPEGSAIVTANDGKNIQALKAYKKGNYKLLNKIIDDMPEDNVDNKAQDGKRATKGKKITGKIQDKQVAPNETFSEESALGYDPSYGQEMNEDKAKELYGLSLSDLIKKRNTGQLPKVSFDLEVERRNAVANNQEEFTYKGKLYLSGLKKQNTKGGTTPTPNTVPIPPAKTPPEDEYEDVDTDTIKAEKPIMSTGETNAIGGVIGQGVPKGPRESYLKLDRYNYASQLPKTLQEIALAEQGGKNTARDIVGGDAGRYLAQAGSLSGARMKANNEAVINDTLARQDILNKNVDLSNTEATTNRSLKDYYDDIKRQNVNDYNALLVKGGQSFDESFDNYQKMKSENELKAQELQLLKEASPNYTMVKDPKTGVMKSVYRYKKVNKTPGATTTGTTAPATTGASSASAGATPVAPTNSSVTPVNPNAAPSTNSFNTQLQNYGTEAGKLQEKLTPKGTKFQSFFNKLELDPFGSKKVGTKKLKTYKRK